MLVKRHESRDPAERESAGRTLFITHLDSFVTEAQLQRCFSQGFGPVDKVMLKSVEKRAPKSEQRADNVHVYVNFAQVTFQAAESCEKALAAATGRIVGEAVLPLPPGELKTHMKLAKEGFYRDASTLREEIDTWMANYDAKMDEKRALARESGKVDEDGFVKIVKGITRTPDGIVMRSAARPPKNVGVFEEAVKGRRDPITQGDKRKKKKTDKEKTDFYRFQLRESRRAEILDHRKRQAEDAVTVERMRKSKRFKASS